ncbi:hypothetical protein PAESOLCIP111_02083 [Paenibacillus solanacearum]|uniref:Uncharacterized protein n=1 Tax=Paenibacillus solanacearum TaxID=2048548 RepID=A0A916NWM7_9BACL|nr:hypothetical protein [Paenibacillus solanacearum]CAG7618103.1 hypothetical protein PAESOLCIP111_02083 [Paenibacillus solanacearum]
MKNVPMKVQKSFRKSVMETKQGIIAQIKRLLTPAGIVAVLLLSACSASGSSESGDPGLMVKLSFSPNHVMVDNGNDFVWKGVSVELNGTYRYAAEVLPRGASSIPFSEFRDEAGNAFERRLSVPHRMTLRVKEGFGGKPGTWQW